MFVKKVYFPGKCVFISKKTYLDLYIIKINIFSSKNDFNLNSYSLESINS